MQEQTKIDTSSDAKPDNKERPILFSGEMVKKILAGSKTQTRRVMKKQPHECHNGDIVTGGGAYLLGSTVPERAKQTGIYEEDIAKLSRYGMPGDRLWVKEALVNSSGFVTYKVDSSPAFSDRKAPGKPELAEWEWQRDVLPGMFCPRWASRITLEVTGLRVERLQDITKGPQIPANGPCNADIKAEGFEYLSDSNYGYDPTNFRHYWDKLNEKRGAGWLDNPFVYVIEFKKVGE